MNWSLGFRTLAVQLDLWNGADRVIRNLERLGAVCVDTPNAEHRTPNVAMIVGTGIDIVNMDRVERMMDRWGNTFLRRVFTEKEILWCQKRIRPAECYATRFAAKEAFLKAIGWGLRNGIQWTDIEVGNDALGKPSFSFHRKAKDVSESLRIRKALLTLSHDRPYAVAHVLLEGTDHEGCDR